MQLSGIPRNEWSAEEIILHGWSLCEAIQTLKCSQPQIKKQNKKQNKSKKHLLQHAYWAAWGLKQLPLTAYSWNVWLTQAILIDNKSCVYPLYALFSWRAENCGQIYIIVRVNQSISVRVHLLNWPSILVINISVWRNTWSYLFKIP